jgi:ABC-type Na+ transport system ATPase subunit NatA
MGAIEVQDLHKRYGRVKAVDGISLCVERGTIFGLLGSNGAGKTTSIECTIGLKRPDGGTIRVLGMDPAGERRTLFRRVGVQLQEANYQERIKVWELCRMYASMYRNAADWGKLLERLGIAEKRNAYMGNLSGATIPMQALPQGVRAVARALPMTYGVELMRAAWLKNPFPWGEMWLPIAVLGGILVVCTALAVGLFRWE